MTAPYAEVIGDPVAQSKSPLIHGFWLRKLGIDAGYRACHVRPDELGEYFAARRSDPDWRGCNITIPHKQTSLACLDSRTGAAQAVGAVNTVWRSVDGALTGTNTDIDGVEAAIGAPQAGKAVIIGAGGAARAAFVCLARHRALAVTVLARSPAKAADAVSSCGLKADICSFDAGSGAFAGASLVINATQLGMSGQDAMPEFVLDELHGMTPRGLVFDMVYAPLQTGLLRAASAAGLATADGLSMLVGQAASAFEVFYGAAPPREHDDELRSILTA